MILSIPRSIQQDAEVDLPQHWRELPPPSVLEGDSWIYEWVDESGVVDEKKADFAVWLRRVALFVIESGESADHSSCRWAVVIDAPRARLSAIAAVSTVELDERALDDIDALAVPRSPFPDAVTWVSQLSQATLGAHPAVVLHEIGVFDFEYGGKVMAERFVGTVVPDEGSTALQLAILTSDLDGVDDIVRVGSAVLAGARFVEV